MRTHLITALLGLGALAACDGGTPPMMMMMPEPLIPSADNPAPTCMVPTGPWGFTVDHVQQPWTVTSCAGQEYALYNDDFCEAAFTVVIHSEPWCAACLEEGPSVRANLIDPYSLMGVRVLEVLQQTESYGTVDAATCDAWAAAYDSEGFTFMDPLQRMSTYTYRPGIDETPPATRSESLPTVNVYDATGTLVYHHEGATNHWRDITTALDELLAGRAPAG